MSKSDRGPALLFYTGPKVMLGMLGLVALVMALVPGRIWKSRGLAGRWWCNRRWLWFLIASLAVVPLVMALLKDHVFDTYCLWDLARYGGNAGAPYCRVLEHYPAEFLASRHGVGKGNFFLPVSEPLFSPSCAPTRKRRNFPAVLRPGLETAA